jgi:outer membrane protein, heavy metal efflux system
MKDFLCSILLFYCLAGSPAGLCGQTSTAEPALSLVHSSLRRLTLPEALARVIERNPELSAFDAEIRAQAGRVLQAGLRPNPEFSSLIENFAGTGQVGLADSIETTFQISQRIETASKRKLRVLAAQSEQQLAAQALLVQKANLLSAAATAFVEVLTAQERVANRQELYTLAEATHSAVVARVAAGRASPIEESRSIVILESVNLEKEKAKKNLQAMKDRLSSLWMGSGSDFETVDAPFQIPSQVASLLQETDLSRNLEVEQAHLAIKSREAALTSELAARKPDFTIGGGYRYLNQYGDSAWVAGITIPLPFFDKRQGAIAEAQQKAEKAKFEKRALENSFRSRLAQLHQQSEIALEEAQHLSSTILPAAKTALERLEEGYRLGKFDFFPVLDAERTYFELKGRQIDAISTLLTLTIEIQSLAGKITAPLALEFLVPSKEQSHEQPK